MDHLIWQVGTTIVATILPANLKTQYTNPTSWLEDTVKWQFYLVLCPNHLRDI